MKYREYKFDTIINNLLDKHNMNPADLAKKLHTSPSTIYNWQNMVCMPNAAKLIELQRIFKVSIDYLLFGEDFKE